MAKTISFTYEDTDYTLEFTRAAVKKLEEKGFDISAVDSKFVTSVTALFRGAFFAHHRGIKAEKIEEIYDALDNKDELLSKLIEMYSETLDTLMTSGNLTWRANG